MHCLPALIVLLHSLLRVEIVELTLTARPWRLDGQPGFGDMGYNSVVLTRVRELYGQQISDSA